MATAAAREGARVSILARNLARLEEARAAIQRESGRGDVGVHAADVRDADAVARALREAGPVDVLVCNHGVFVPQELERQDMEEIKWMVDINLMGTFHLIKAVLPAMKARTRETRFPGSIAIMSSQAGQVDVSLLRCFARHAAKLFDVMLLAGETKSISNRLIFPISLFLLCPSPLPYLKGISPSLFSSPFLSILS